MMPPKTKEQFAETIPCSKQQEAKAHSGQHTAGRSSQLVEAPVVNTWVLTKCPNSYYNEKKPKVWAIIISKQNLKTIKAKGSIEDGSKKEGKEVKKNLQRKKFMRESKGVCVLNAERNGTKTTSVELIKYLWSLTQLI